MSKERFAGIRLQLSGWISEIWGELSGDSLLAASGRRQQILGKAQLEGAAASEQAARQLAEFHDQHRNWYF